MRLPNTGGVAAWKSFGMESLNPQFSMNREFEVAPETMKVPRHPCTISAQHHRRTARPTSSSATVSKVVGRFETHIMGSANWMEQNTHWTCSYCHFLCLQSSSLVFEDTRVSSCSFTDASKMSEVLSSHATGVFLCHSNEWNTRRQPDFVVLVFYAELWNFWHRLTMFMRVYALQRLYRCRCQSNRSCL